MIADYKKDASYFYNVLIMSLVWFSPSINTSICNYWKLKQCLFYIAECQIIKNVDTFIIAADGCFKL